MTKTTKIMKEKFEKPKYDSREKKTGKKNGFGFRAPINLSIASGITKIMFFKAEGTGNSYK